MKKLIVCSVILLVGAAAALSQINDREKWAKKSYQQTWGFPFPEKVLLEVSKSRQIMIVLIHARGMKEGAYRIIDTIPVCAMDKKSGTKICQGDGKTPEGRYKVTAYNPSSAFWLSMKINYPSPEDRARAKAEGCNAGGDIFIHGSCVTAGCIAVHKWIYPLYWLCKNTRLVDVHIYS
jgi:murein L,D-transpeptidase YafK